MPIFEVLGEIVVEAFMEFAIVSGISKISGKVHTWITGKDTSVDGYKTEHVKFIKFSSARKFLMVWEHETEHLKEALRDGLEATNEKTSLNDFQFLALNDKTIIHPPASISFYTFHFLIQSLGTVHKIKTLGIVETTRTIYTAYNDPNSEYLIGSTSKGKKFFITLMEDYTRRQFLRINSTIETLEELSVEKIKNEITILP